MGETMYGRLFGRTWASFFHVDPGGAFLEALVAGRGSVVLKGEIDIVMEQESWERCIISICMTQKRSIRAGVTQRFVNVYALDMGGLDAHDNPS